MLLYLPQEYEYGHYWINSELFIVLQKYMKILLYFNFYGTLLCEFAPNNHTLWYRKLIFIIISDKHIRDTL